MKTPTELVVFDVAGTTVDDGDLVIDAVDDALRTADVCVDREAIRALMGVPKPVAIRTLLERHGGRMTDIGARTHEVHEAFLERIIELYRHARSLQEIDGASDVFLALHERGIKVALDTGFSRAILDVVLERLGWAASGLIDCSVTSDEVPRGRPSPDLIRHAMQLTGVVNARAVAKVGDTPADIHSGRAASCGYVIGVSYGTHSRAELESHHPDAVIDRLTSVVPLVDGI